MSYRDITYWHTVNCSLPSTLSAEEAIWDKRQRVGDLFTTIKEREWLDRIIEWGQVPPIVYPVEMRLKMLEQIIFSQL